MNRAAKPGAIRPLDRHASLKNARKGEVGTLVSEYSELSDNSTATAGLNNSREKAVIVKLARGREKATNKLYHDHEKGSNAQQH